MENKEILELVRAERPNQKIHEVKSFEKNDLGFYDVHVDMEGMFFETTVLHIHMKLPYPIREYEKLSKKQQLDWRWE